MLSLLSVIAASCSSNDQNTLGPSQDQGRGVYIPGTGGSDQGAQGATKQMSPYVSPQAPAQPAQPAQPTPVQPETPIETTPNFGTPKP